MAGHSKWANIKHRKSAQDAKRSKIFTKVIKELTVASKEGGVDPEMNPRLRLAIQKAKEANLPKDTMERAIKKGSGADAENYEEVTYEGYGPGGVAVFVEAMTDNINRTVANLRMYLTKSGGSLGTNGSVAYMFERKAVFTVDSEGRDEEELLLELIDAGVEEVENEGEIFVITSGFEDYGSVSSKLEEMGITPKSTELSRIPTTTTALDLDGSQKVLKLIDSLEDDDDVQNVYHNLELTDELLTALS